jgi:hypothetical protein
VAGRGNGLSASTYSAVADVEPQLADALLEMFRDEGIAAYATPAAPRGAGDLNLHRVKGAMDRVFVDSTARERARAVLDARLPGLRAEFEAEQNDRRGTGTDADDDAAWRAIVAAYDRPSTDVVPRWPTSEDVADDPEATGQPSEAPSGWGTPKDTDEPRRSRRVGDPDEERYQPPPPPPLPRVDPITRAAWCGVLGVPLFFLVTTIAGVELPDGLALLALAAFVGGFVTLVARMKDRPPNDSGPDDGAVV